MQSLPAIFQSIENEDITKLQPLIAKSSKPWCTDPNRLYHRINYTSLRRLSQIEDPLKRAFYEHELIQGCWSTRQLDRQISSLYFERSALSKDKAVLQLPSEESIRQYLIDTMPSEEVFNEYGEVEPQNRNDNL